MGRTGLGRLSFLCWLAGQSLGTADPKGKGKNKEPPRKKEENAFPTYEDMKIPSHTAAAGQELLPAGLPQPGRGNGGLARHVQRAVNNLRRSETRLRKLGEEEDAAKAKWEQFQQQLKASFITERGRYYEKLGATAEREDRAGRAAGRGHGGVAACPCGDWRRQDGGRGDPAGGRDPRGTSSWCRPSAWRTPPRC